jgi:hypothetical protein
MAAGPMGDRPSMAGQPLPSLEVITCPRLVRMVTPGFYKTDHRRLTLREMVRWHGLWRLPAIYIATRKPPRTAGFWMPALWADLGCEKSELSEAFWKATGSQREGFERLGFKEVGFGRLKQSLNLHPLARDDAKLTYLDAERSCIGMLFYTRFWVPSPINKNHENITIAFSRIYKDTVVSSSNNKHSFDPANGEEVIRLRSEEVGVLHSALARKCAGKAEASQVFADDATLRAWFDRHQITTFESRVRRGLFVKMTEQEIAAARAQLNRPT